MRLLFITGFLLRFMATLVAYLPLNLPGVMHCRCYLTTSHKGMSINVFFFLLFPTIKFRQVNNLIMHSPFYSGFCMNNFIVATWNNQFYKQSLNFRYIYLVHTKLFDFILVLNWNNYFSSVMMRLWWLLGPRLQISLHWITLSVWWLQILKQTLFICQSF